jgi:hypothetical protein
VVAAVVSTVDLSGVGNVLERPQDREEREREREKTWLGDAVGDSEGRGGRVLRTQYGALLLSPSLHTINPPLLTCSAPLRS